MSKATPLSFSNSPIRFQCTECGACCTGAPGYVYIEEEEIERIATFLEVDVNTFKKQYTRRVGSRLSLIEKKNYDCIFLKEKKCQLYQARPKQCRTFPFWPHLMTDDGWEEAKKVCEGIGHGPILSSEEIKKIAFE